MNLRTWCVVCGAALIIGGCVGTGIEPSSVPAGPPPVAITSEELRGYSVLSRDGEQLGLVDGVVMHVETGAIDYVVVRIPDRYHYGKGAYGPPNDKFLLIPWSHLEVDVSRHVLVADVDAAVLAQAPVLDRVPSTSLPNWDADLVRFWADL